MKFTTTDIEDLWVIEPQVYEDHRGYFVETFNQKEFKDTTGLAISFVQDNESKSSKGVLRGMHFQKGEWAQAKLVRVLEGIVQDVAVDLRPNSKTYGKCFTIILSSENRKQLFVPRALLMDF